MVYNIKKKVIAKSKTIKEFEYSIQLEKKVAAKAFVQESQYGFRLVDLHTPYSYRNKGIATILLNNILKDADSNCYKITGIPVSSDYRDKNKLINFYRKFGFEYNKDINEIIRKPKCQIT